MQPYACLYRYACLYIGLMDDGRLVVFDFGIARLMPCTQRHLEEGSAMTGICVSIRYMAPEVLAKQSQGTPVDVYSFGLLVCFAATACDPHLPSDVHGR